MDDILDSTLLTSYRDCILSLKSHCLLALEQKDWPKIGPEGLVDISRLEELRRESFYVSPDMNDYKYAKGKRICLEILSSMSLNWLHPFEMTRVFQIISPNQSFLQMKRLSIFGAEFLPLQNVCALCPSLEVLELFAVSGDIMLSDLITLKHLKSLTINSCDKAFKFGDNGWLKRLNPTLQYLDLKDTCVTSAMIKSLNCLESLVSLDVSLTMVSAGDLVSDEDFLSRTESLEYFRFGGSCVAESREKSNEFLFCFRKVDAEKHFPSLKEISLFSDVDFRPDRYAEIVRHLSKLPKFESFVVYRSCNELEGVEKHRMCDVNVEIRKV